MASTRSWCCAVHDLHVRIRIASPELAREFVDRAAWSVALRRRQNAPAAVEQTRRSRHSGPECSVPAIGWPGMKCTPLGTYAAAPSRQHRALDRAHVRQNGASPQAAAPISARRWRRMPRPARTARRDRRRAQPPVRSRRSVMTEAQFTRPRPARRCSRVFSTLDDVADDGAREVLRRTRAWHELSRPMPISPSRPIKRHVAAGGEAFGRGHASAAEDWSARKLDKRRDDLAGYRPRCRSSCARQLGRP